MLGDGKRRMDQMEWKEKKKKGEEILRWKEKEEMVKWIEMKKKGGDSKAMGREGMEKKN